MINGKKSAARKARRGTDTPREFNNRKGDSRVIVITHKFGQTKYTRRKQRVGKKIILHYD